MRSPTILDFTFFCGLILTALAILPATVAAQSNDHVSIQAHSGWVGLGGRKESVATAKAVRGQCYVDGKLVDSKLIDNFLRELNAPADAPSLANLGITQTWLDQNAVAAYANHAQDQPKVDRAKFLASFRNLALVEKLLPELVRGGWTDDYPSLELKVDEGGKISTVTSKRQNLFMIPFEITENGATRTSYNAKLARALVAWLPANFANRDRLGGNNLRSLLADKVIMQMRGQIFGESAGQ
jgi:hypothetical protein